jgi:hypothetical protein
MIVKLNNVRLAFANLFAPDQKYARYGASFPIEPSSENAKLLDAAVENLAKEKWAGKAPQILQKLRQEGLIAFQHTAKSNSEGAVYEGFAGMWTLSCSSPALRPTVVDRRGMPITAEDGLIYSGCWVNAHVDLWAQENAWGRRINCSLAGVQLVRGDTAFGGGARVTAADFEDLGDFEESLA